MNSSSDEKGSVTFLSTDIHGSKAGVWGTNPIILAAHAFAGVTRPYREHDCPIVDGESVRSEGGRSRAYWVSP